MLRIAVLREISLGRSIREGGKEEAPRNTNRLLSKEGMKQQPPQPRTIDSNNGKSIHHPTMEKPLVNVIATQRQKANSPI